MACYCFFFKKKIIWAADSWEGLPVPVHPEDKKQFSKGQFLKRWDKYINTLTRMEIKRNTIDKKEPFEGIIELKGWLNETLPTAPIQTISFLRIDVDMWSSTMESLDYLYDKVVLGGIIYVDDFGEFIACRQAVLEFMKKNNINDQLYKVMERPNKYEGIYFVKGSSWSLPLDKPLYGFAFTEPQPITCNSNTFQCI